jgi:phosphatidylinositol alpha-1,6-mannosyltransferase
MQRVATELQRELSRNPDVDLSSIVLRTSSRWSAIRTAPFLWSAYRRIKKLAVGDQIDVVMFSSMVTASLTVFLSSVLEKKGVRSLAIAHGDDVISPSRVYQRFLPRVFKSLDVVLPVSAATKRACLERGAQENKVIVVPNGIDPKRFACDQLPKDAVREIGLEKFIAMDVYRKVEELWPTHLMP